MHERLLFMTSRYHTAICKKGAACQRTLCFFAHQPSELRTPARRPRLPPGAAAAALRMTQIAGATKAPVAAADAAPAAASAISLPASSGVDAPAASNPMPAAAGPPAISSPHPRPGDWMRWRDSSGLLNNSGDATISSWSNSNCSPSSNGNSGSTRVGSSGDFSNSVYSLASQVGGWSGLRAAPDELRFAGLQSQEAGSSRMPLHNADVAALLGNQVLARRDRVCFRCNRNLLLPGAQEAGMPSCCAAATAAHDALILGNTDTSSVSVDCCRLAHDV
jgi:hypothetical protein